MPFSDLLENVQEELNDETNVRKAIVLFVWLIIIAVVSLCEIMYCKIMILGFPDGLVRWVAIIGAVATGLSVIALYAGKSHWFSKGHQTWAAWAFTFVEIAILVLNVLLAFNFNDPSLAFWKQAYPAAPIVALVGWGFILYLDRSNIMRRKQRTMKEAEHDSELKYEHLVHKTRMAVKTSSLQIVANKLEAKLQAPTNLAHLDNIASQIYDSILGEISGKHITQLPGPHVVDSTLAQPQQLAAPTQASQEQQSSTPKEAVPPQANSTPVQDEQQLSPEEMQRRLQWIMDNVPMLGATSPLATPASLHQNGHVTPEQATNQTKE